MWYSALPSEHSGDGPRTTVIEPGMYHKRGFAAGRLLLFLDAGGRGCMRPSRSEPPFKVSGSSAPKSTHRAAAADCEGRHARRARGKPGARGHANNSTRGAFSGRAIFDIQWHDKPKQKQRAEATECQRWQPSGRPFRSRSAAAEKSEALRGANPDACALVVWVLRQIGAAVTKDTANDGVLLLNTKGGPVYPLSDC
jgi:hypothetical protein